MNVINSMDDAFMSRVFEDDIECTELLLHIIMDNPYFDRVIKETGRIFNDESHIIYVNGSYIDESPLGYLMHDMLCANPDEMHYKILANKTRYYKEDRNGELVMSNIMEELFNEGRAEEKKEIAKRCLQLGKLSIEEIALCSGLSIEEVKKLAETQLAYK